MDELLRALQGVSVQLLPFLGVVVLIFLILILRRVYLLLADIGITVVKVNSAMDKVNSSLDEFKMPLSTLSRLSHSIDLVHTATESAIKGAVRVVSENYEWIKDTALSAVNKVKTKKTQPKGENEDE
ncbi:MAG: hypothetical protein CVU85_03435 [Firmicutes bacterium HGW-Firmicutes-10]|jgi:hypothetical protein|nr:MAG: hypothetical protein CVU85_03435 [Firmicutes bacterium HGW-Firmicutes-10]